MEEQRQIVVEQEHIVQHSQTMRMLFLQAELQQVQIKHGQSEQRVVALVVKLVMREILVNCNL